MKKFLSLVVAALLMVSAVATSATAAKFTDVDATNEALNEAVELLVTLGITKGTTDTTFGADENVTRQQMAAFMYRIMNDRTEATNFPNNTKFADLVDPYYNFVISWANEEGIIKGTKADGTAFNPTGSIILMDAYTMAVRALGYDDGTLTYPIGYINKAEDLGLDENLPSELGYSDTLTRGDVAILLANMFYAETAEVKIGYATTAPDANGMTTTYPIEYHETLAESVFKITKDTYRVVATKSYALGEYAQNTSAVDMLTVEKDGDGKKTDDNTVKNFMFDELGLEGTSDDYFLLDITVYEKEGEIFAASTLGTKETLGTADVVITSKKWKNKANKEFGGVNEKFTIKGVEHYLLNAPYTYAGDLDGGYDFNNVKLLTLANSGSTTQYDYNLFPLYDNYFKNANASWDSTNLAGYALGAEPSTAEGGPLGVLARGAYGEYDVYDSNGDGKCDYMLAKTYVIGKIDTTATKKIADNVNVGNVKAANHRHLMSVENNPLYTAATTMAPDSISFKNGDLVLAYVDLTANYMKVVEVVSAEPVTAKVVTVTSANFTLNNDTVVPYAYEGKYPCIYTLWNSYNPVNGVYSTSSGHEHAKYDADGNPNTVDMKNEYDFFFHNGRLVYSKSTKAVTNTSIKVDTDWAIVLEAKTTAKYVLGADGSLTPTEYVKAYIGGEIKEVKALSIVDGTAKTPTTVNGDNKYDFSGYVNKLAEAKTDKDGNYYFELLDMTKQEALTGTTADDAAKEHRVSQNGADPAVTTTFFKNANGSLKLGAESYNGLYAMDGAQFIIRSKNDKNEWIVEKYTVDNLPKIANTINFTAEYVLVNNIYSTKYENIAVFYGVYDGKLAAGGASDTTTLAVLKDIASTSINEDEKYERIYNTWTIDGAYGKVEGAGTDVERAITFGDIYVLDSEGKLVDTAAAKGNITTKGGKMYVKGGDLTGLGCVEISAYDPTSGLLEVKGDAKEYYVTKNTTLAYADRTSKTIIGLNALEDAINSTDKLWTYDGVDGAAKFAFLVVEETDTANVYNVVNVIVVRA